MSGSNKEQTEKKHKYMGYDFCNVPNWLVKKAENLGLGKNPYVQTGGGLDYILTQIPRQNKPPMDVILTNIELEGSPISPDEKCIVTVFDCKEEGYWDGENDIIDNEFDTVEAGLKYMVELLLKGLEHPDIKGLGLTK